MDHAPASLPHRRDEHRIPVADNLHVHLLSCHNPSAPPRRALLLLPGTLVDSTLFTLPLQPPSGDDVLDMAAQHGFVALAPSYVGYGKSDTPADGRLINLRRCVQDVACVMNWAQAHFGIDEFVAVGVSFGAAVGLSLPAIGRIALFSMIYKQINPALRDAILSPMMRDMLQNAPGGRLQTTAEHYQPLLMHAGADVAHWAQRHWVGTYAVGPTLAGFDLPLCDVTQARAKALLFWGDADVLTPWSDIVQLKHEYGGDLQVEISPGTGHAPILEENRSLFWGRALAFLAA